MTMIDTTKLGYRTRRLLMAAVIAGALGIRVAPAGACEPELYAAAAKYASCDLRFFGKVYANVSIDVVERLVAKCRRAYASTWSKLVAKFAGAPSACTGPRFVDHGDGTMTDALTGLRWELKTDDGGFHDKGHVYSWSGGISEATGTVFTDFLATLNDECFAGHCDWRLPTRPELQTLMSSAYPCTTPPCVDPGVPGATASAFYWSSTTNVTGDGFVWGVQFASGVFGAYPKSLSTAARAVRSAW